MGRSPIRVRREADREGDLVVTRAVSVLRDAKEEVFEHEGEMRIPVRPATGVERDRVVETAVTRLGRIADRIAQAFPDQSLPRP